MKLHPIQEKVLTRLAEGDAITADMEDLGIPSSVRSALNSLRRHGLAEIAGTIPPVSPDGRGRASNVWSITDKGREALSASASGAGS